jgi:hypothetical protein
MDLHEYGERRGQASRIHESQTLSTCLETSSSRYFGKNPRYGGVLR